MPNHYEVLEVSSAATIEEIKSQYKKLALQYHPDKNKSEGAAEKFKMISSAYDILGKLDARLQYDRKLSASQIQPQAKGVFQPNPLQRIYDSLSIIEQDGLEEYRLGNQKLFRSLLVCYDLYQHDRDQFIRTYDPNRKPKYASLLQKFILHFNGITLENLPKTCQKDPLLLYRLFYKSPSEITKLSAENLCNYLCNPQSSYTTAKDYFHVILKNYHDNVQLFAFLISKYSNNVQDFLPYISAQVLTEILRNKLVSNPESILNAVAMYKSAVIPQLDAKAIAYCVTKSLAPRILRETSIDKIKTMLRNNLLSIEKISSEITSEQKRDAGLILEILFRMSQTNENCEWIFEADKLALVFGELKKSPSLLQHIKNKRILKNLLQYHQPILRDLLAIDSSALQYFDIKILKSLDISTVENDIAFAVLNELYRHTELPPCQYEKIVTSLSEEQLSDKNIFRLIDTKVPKNMLDSRLNACSHKTIIKLLGKRLILPSNLPETHLQNKGVQAAIQYCNDTQYPYGHTPQNRFHFFKVKISQTGTYQFLQQIHHTLTGDALKKGILNAFEVALDQTETHEELAILVSRMKNSEEFKILKTAQGLFSYFFSLSTTSNKALVAMINLKFKELGSDRVYDRDLKFR